MNVSSDSPPGTAPFDPSRAPSCRQGELRISHEWRASEDVPSSLGTAIPLNLKELSKHVDITKTIRLNDTSAPDLDHKVRFLAKSLRTRSLLVVPVTLGADGLRVVGLH